MPYLVTGPIVDKTKIQVETVYNLSSPYNEGLEISPSVVVEDIDYPEPQFGKFMVHIVDMETGEQTFEFRDRELTPEEKVQKQLEEQADTQAQILMTLVSNNLM
ncbi:hypothetical protein D1872_81030 [compost metagenome]